MKASRRTMMEIDLAPTPSQGTWKNLQIVQVEEADTLWVREVPSEHMSSNLSEFQKMEAQMNEKFGKLLYRQMIKTFPAKIGERVLVHHKNQWHRARVIDINVNSKDQVAEAFLLDYGISVKVEAKAVICIKDTDWASVPHQAKKVRLFALTPLSLGYSLTATGFSIIPRMSSVWDPAATSFVRNLVELRHKAEFLPLEDGPDECTQGLVTIFLENESYESFPELTKMNWPKKGNNQRVIDLSKLLVACDFAKFATEVLVDKMTTQSKKRQKEDLEVFQRANFQLESRAAKFSTDSDSESGGEGVDRELSKLELRKRNHKLPRCRGLLKMMDYGSSNSESISNMESSTDSMNPSSRTSGRGRGLLSLIEGKLWSSSTLSRGNSSNALSSVDECSNGNMKDEFMKNSMNRMVEPTCSEGKNHSNITLHLEEIPAPSSCQKSIFESDVKVCNQTPENKATCSALPNVKPDTASADMQRKELKIPNSVSLKNGATVSKNGMKTRSRRKACFISDSRDVWDKEEMGDVEENFQISPIEDISEGPCIAKLFRVFVAGETPLAIEDVIIDECMLDAVLNSHIVKVLDDLQMKAKRLQAFAWPAITRGTSSIIIGEKKSGKTVGYIVPLISTILDMWQHISRRLVAGVGAVLIIVCNDWRSTKFTSDFLVRFLPAQMGLKVVATWGGCGDEEALDANLQLLGGCDILVTTAPCLVRLLLGGLINPTKGKEKEDTEAFTSLSRCCYLVFDDIDLILEHFAKEVKLILKQWGEARNKNGRKDVDQQLILVASSWTKLLSSLTLTVNTLLDPTVIISDPWEASVATKTCTFIHPVEESESEHNKIVKLLQDNRHGKIMVFVQDDEFAKKLTILLDAVTLYSLVVLNTTTMWVMKSIVHEWHSLLNVILIVCPDAMPLLFMHDLANAEMIVHADIPRSLLSFKMRYAFMINNFSTDLSKESINCESHVLVSKKCVRLLPSLLLELSRACKIPKDLEFDSSQAVRSCNRYDALCYYLKAYGKCCIGYRCKFRHQIQHIDIESAIPRQGEVTFSVVKVMNASRYLVRLLSFREKTGDSEFNFRDHYLMLSMAMQQYYADPENCENMSNVEPGMFCAVKSKERWVRGQIIETDYCKHMPFFVFLLDEGIEMTFCLESIFTLPNQFALMPPLIFEVYLCRVKPQDFDKEWSYRASKYIDDIFNGITNKSTFVGKVELALGTTLWLSPVIELVQAGMKAVKMESLRSKLISNGFGVNNPEHIDILKELCRQAGIHLTPEELSCELFKSTMEKAAKCLKDGEEISLSEMEEACVVRQNPCNVIENNVSENLSNISDVEYTDSSAKSADDVRIDSSEQMTDFLLQETLLQNADIDIGIAEIESPEWFFIQLVDNYEKLDKLELEVEEITKHWVEEDHEMLNERSLKWKENPSINPCSYCLAKFTDGNFYRGWVDKVTDDGVAKVFFVDHGETLSLPSLQIQPCPTYLLKVLPAQAIPCCLADFSFSAEKLKEVKEVMEQVADSVDTWTARVLEVIESVDGKMYRVELTDNSVEPPRLMSKELKQKLLSSEKEETNMRLSEERLNATDEFDVSSLGREEALNFLHSLPNFQEMAKSVTSSNIEEDEEDERRHVPKESAYKSDKIAKAVSETKDEEYRVSNKRIVAQKQACDGMSQCENVSGNMQQGVSKTFRNAKSLKNDSEMFNQMCLEVPPLEAVKGVTCRLYPETLWSQTERMIVVSIQLPGVQHYKCRFASNHLTFMTVVRDKFYMIEETLSDEIDADSSTLKLKGMFVLINLTKTSETMWHSLFMEKVKRPWLKYQGSSLDDKGSLLSNDNNEMDDIEPWTDMQPEEEMNQYGGFPAGISDSSSESDSDGAIDELIT